MSDDLEDTNGKLTPRQQELVDTLVSEGGTHEEIAARMDTARSWVTKTLHKPHVQAAILAAIGPQITMGAGQAIATMQALLRSRSDYVKLEAGKDLLDRAGFKPPDRKLVAVKGDVSIHIDLT